MNKKYLFIASGLILTGVTAFLYYKNKSKTTESTIPNPENGDKTSSTSLSDAQTKTSQQTTPVNMIEANAIAKNIASDIANKARYKKQSSKNNIQKEIDSLTQKLYGMGFVALANGELQAI